MLNLTENNSKPAATNWRPAGLSLLLHLILVIILIVFGKSVSKSLSTEPDRRGSIVLAIAPEDKPQEYLTEQDSLTDVADPVAITSERPPLLDTTPPPVSLPETNSTIDELDGPPPLDTLTDANRMTEVPTELAASQPYELTAEDLKLIEADQRLLRSRAPKGDPTSVRLFGSGAMEGRSFVFLIDRSKSMGADGLGVLTAARTELAKAIADLKPHHSFQIVGYHDRTVTMESRQMLDATDANKQLVPGFIDNLAAFGSTNHLNGLSIALAFEPDVVVMLTDGGYPELNNGQLRMLSRLSRRDTTIHCLQFGSGPLQIPVNFMTRLAEQNQGSYRYVDTNRWRKSTP